MKVVVDTNIFVSSFFGGKPKQIIDLWKSDKIIICFSQSILDEYVRVLTRIGLVNEQELNELLGLFKKGFNSIYSANPDQIKIVKNDPDDNKFIECAVAANSKFIISGDNDLLNIKSYFDIQIVNPSAFLKKLDH